MCRFACLLTDAPDTLPADWALRSFAGEEPGSGSVAFPVGAKQVEQSWREHYLAILAALCLTDTDDLPLAVDIGHPQVDDLGNPQAGRIDGHEDRAMFEVAGDPKDRRYFGAAQDDGQLLFVSRVRNMFDHPVSVQRVVIEESQCAHGLVEDRPGDLLLLDEEELVLPDVFGAEPIRRAPKMLAEPGHPTDVNLDGLW